MSPTRSHTAPVARRSLARYVVGSGALVASQVAGAGILSFDYGDVSISDPDPVNSSDTVPAFSIDLTWGASGFAQPGVVTFGASYGALADHELLMGAPDYATGDEPPNPAAPGPLSVGGGLAYVKGATGDTFDAGSDWAVDEAVLFEGADQVLGLRIADGADYHYGWLRYSVAVDGVGLTLHEAAFETSPGTVPAPASLVLLTTGIAGVAAARRRRNRAA